MRLLVVGFAGSPHIARYLELLADTGWEIHLFDSDSFMGLAPHPEIPSAITLHPWPGRGEGSQTASDRERVSLQQRANELAELWQEIGPDVIHSHEIQHGAALVRYAREACGLNTPWLVTNWGSDIYWFGRDPAHGGLIRSVLATCDYYGAECHRDVALARAFGLRGTVIGVWPVAGGIDLSQVETLRSRGPTSARRSIAVKAGPAGALSRWPHALTAIERCVDLLSGWEVCAYQIAPDADIWLRALEAAGEIRYTRVSSAAVRESDHAVPLAMHGRARVSLALNRSDGMSTSFLEAVAMGSFPVQGATSCGREFVPPGRGALFVSPNDPDAVADALRRALSDDQLVDTAARLNARAASEFLDRRRIKMRVIDAYERIVSERALNVA